MAPSSPGDLEGDLEALLERKLSGEDSVRRAEVLGCRDAVGEPVRRDDRRRARHAQELHEEEAERPAAEDAGARTRTDVPEVERVQRHAERLRERGLDVGERLGHRMHEPLGPREERAQGAVGRAVTGEADGRAEVFEPRRTGLARAARNGGIDGNAFALTRAGGDHARELVPEHERMLELRRRRCRPRAASDGRSRRDPRR